MLFTVVYLVPLLAEPAVSVNSSPAKAAEESASRSRSGTDTLPSSVSEPVQTQQPCSLKASMSSDNVYSGLQGEGAGVYSQPGQGKLHLKIIRYNPYRLRVWCVLVLGDVPTVTLLQVFFASCLFFCVQAGLRITQQLRGSLTNPAVNLVLDS